jgi:hypothetical protein
MMVLEEAAQQGVDVVFTFVYAHPEDIPLVEAICGPVERAGGRILFVQLRCAAEELDRRVVSEGRAAMEKISTVERLRRMSQRWDMSQAIPGRVSLIIDNTDVAPDEVARRIVEHYRLPANEA